MDMDKIKQVYNELIGEIDNLLNNVDDSVLIDYVEDVRDSQGRLKDFMDDEY